MSNNVTPKVWEQLSNEPNEAYTRFLIYRNLGMNRSLDAAYEIGAGKAPKGKKKQPAAGQWTKDSTTYKWRERATTWDAWQLVNVVPEATTTIFRLIQETAKVSLEQLLSGAIKPTNFAELKEVVTLLANFISPEVITATIDNNRMAGTDEAAPTPNSSTDDA